MMMSEEEEEEKSENYAASQSIYSKRKKNIKLYIEMHVRYPVRFFFLFGYCFQISVNLFNFLSDKN